MAQRFYPGSRPGECSSGTVLTFDKACAALESGAGNVARSPRAARALSVRSFVVCIEDLLIWAGVNGRTPPSTPYR